MPEGPEVKVTSVFINTVCNGQLFSGSPARSSVSKNCEVLFDSTSYTISSKSRGKELALELICQENPKNSLRILFRFGMSGHFKFTAANELCKHSHLTFYTTSSMALSFVDSRRFGSWTVCDTWGENRGPDPMYEYAEFRTNIMDNITDRLFDKPICEALLNQKYFNGIGNYLRAEILYRACIPPFLRARDSILSNSSFLELCHSVPLEVVGLRTCENALIKETSTGDQDFNNWLRCYKKASLRNLVDHTNRTIWFQGEAGPLVPKVLKSRRKRSKSTTKRLKLDVSTDEDFQS